MPIISDPPSRASKLMLIMALSTIAVVGMTLALVRFSTPGYAGGRTPGLILQAFLQENPTPVPTPVAAACGVRIAQRMTIVTNTVGIDLSNDGAAATLRAVTAVWPSANGELREIRLGERTIWAGVEADGSATVFPDLAQTLPTIKTGEETTLTLGFSNAATPDDYLVILHLGNSCYAMFDSSQNTAHLQSCFLTFDRFDVNEQEAALVVRNTTSEPLLFHRFLVFWPDDVAAINSIQFDDGDNLISEPAERSPVDRFLPVGSEVTLQPEQSSRMSLLFNGLAPVVGYSIALQTDECRSVFSNVEPASDCPVRQEGNLQVIDQAVGLVLQNPSGVNQSIEGIWLTYPASNTALVDVTLNDVSIANPSSGLFPKTSSPASMTAGVDLLPDVSLPPFSRSSIGFVFDHDAAPRHYTVELDLSGGCRLLTSTRTEDPAPCRVEVEGDAPIRTETNRLWLTIHNNGQVQAELRAVQVDWEPQFNGALTQVALKDVSFWEGERVGPTATVTHNTNSDVPILEPGESAQLRLTFANEVVERPYVFRLDFAEGCRLSHATQPELAMPTPVEFPGVIRALPDNAFDGVWRIEVSAGRVVSVLVNPQTVIESQGLAPRINDFARVRALEIGLDEYLATRIDVRPHILEPIFLTGVIEDVDFQVPAEYIIVQGIRVDITSETTIDGQLETGWLAEVDGYRRADESVLARNIRTTEPSVRKVDFRGLVEDWQEISDEESLWVLSGLRVIVNRSSTIHHGIEPGAQPELNAEVQVAGELVSAGTVSATELWYIPGLEVVEEFSGIIRKLPLDARFHGTWIIEDSGVGTCDPEATSDSGACKSIYVSESTFLDVSEASPAVGMPVQVRARQNPDGNLAALWIKVLFED